jgi:hypothetical protein
VELEVLELKAVSHCPSCSAVTSSFWKLIHVTQLQHTTLQNFSEKQIFIGRDGVLRSFCLDALKLNPSALGLPAVGL